MANPKQRRQFSSDIRSIQELQDGVRNLMAVCEEGVTLYFRGESENGWPLRPSIARCGLAMYECNLLQDLSEEHPDVKQAPSALAQWSLAQHHGLPTRFLDLTKDAVVALFFACGGYDKKYSQDGRLRVFAVPPGQVIQYDSPTASVIANFAKLRLDAQHALLTSPTEEPGPSALSHPQDFSEGAKRHLLRLIQHEKPSMSDYSVQDLYRVFFIEPEQSNKRVIVQKGAFLASASQGRFEIDQVIKKGDGPVYDYYDLRVPSSCKRRILNNLRQGEITKGSLFPTLDSSAKEITRRYLKIGVDGQSQE